jgi:hypothetical protein
MAPYEWSQDPVAAAHRLSSANADAQARLTFAVECVNGLHYLVDLDEHLVPTDAATQVLSHNWQVVDMAHVRWAASSAITALNLCAAALGRLYCEIRGNKKDLTVQSDALDAVPGKPSNWITAVRCDDHYIGLRELRDALTHRVRERCYSVRTADAVRIADTSLTSDHVGARSPEAARAHAEAVAEAQPHAEAASGTDRTRFLIDDRNLPVPEVLRLARDVATKHVEAFIALDFSI